MGICRFDLIRAFCSAPSGRSFREPPGRREAPCILHLRTVPLAFPPRRCPQMDDSVEPPAADRKADAAAATDDADALEWWMSIGEGSAAVSPLAGRCLADGSGMTLNFDSRATGLHGCIVRCAPPKYRPTSFRLFRTATMSGDRLKVVELSDRAPQEIDMLLAQPIYFGPPPELRGFATRTEAKIATAAIAAAVRVLPTEIATLVASYAAFGGRRVRLCFAETRAPPSCALELSGRRFSELASPPPPPQLPLALPEPRPVA